MSRVPTPRPRTRSSTHSLAMYSQRQRVWPRIPPTTVPAESRTTNLTGCSPDGPSRSSLKASSPRTTRASSAGVTSLSILRSSEPSSSELFKNLFCLLGIVADDREFDQVVCDASDVKCLEVDSRVAESVRDASHCTGLVLEQHRVDFALREPNVRCFESAARYYDIIRENARHRHAAEGHCREGFDVDATSGECLQHSAEIPGVIRELDG